MAAAALSDRELLERALPELAGVGVDFSAGLVVVGDADYAWLGTERANPATRTGWVLLLPVQ